MKKNIGTNLALYPTPLVVVGTMVDGNRIPIYGKSYLLHHTATIMIPL